MREGWSNILRGQVQEYCSLELLCTVICFNHEIRAIAIRWIAFSKSVIEDIIVKIHSSTLQLCCICLSKFGLRVALEFKAELIIVIRKSLDKRLWWYVVRRICCRYNQVLIRQDSLLWVKRRSELSIWLFNKVSHLWKRETYDNQEYWNEDLNNKAFSVSSINEKSLQK